MEESGGWQVHLSLEMLTCAICSLYIYELTTRKCFGQMASRLEKTKTKKHF